MGSNAYGDWFSPFCLRAIKSCWKTLSAQPPSSQKAELVFVRPAALARDFVRVAVRFSVRLYSAARPRNDQLHYSGL